MSLKISQKQVFKFYPVLNIVNIYELALKHQGRFPNAADWKLCCHCIDSSGLISTYSYFITITLILVNSPYSYKQLLKYTNNILKYFWCINIDENTSHVYKTCSFYPLQMQPTHYNKVLTINIHIRLTTSTRKRYY